MNLNDDFRVVANRFIDNKRQLTAIEIEEAGKILVRKALVNMAALMSTSNTIGGFWITATTLKGIALTKNKKSKRAIYTAAQDMINNDGHYCAMVQNGYMQGGVQVKKWRLVVWISCENTTEFNRTIRDKLNTIGISTLNSNKDK